MHKSSKSLIPKSPKGAKFGIVISETNKSFCDVLLDGSLKTLKASGVNTDQLPIMYVPGSFEIPLGCARMIKRLKVDAVIALGVLLKGKTPHFDTLCHQVLGSILKLSLETDVPVGFGIVMANTLAQAKERAGSNAGNKGIESAIAAIKMLSA